MDAHTPSYTHLSNETYTLLTHKEPFSRPPAVPREQEALSFRAGNAKAPTCSATGLLMDPAKILDTTPLSPL